MSVFISYSQKDDAAYKIVCRTLKDNHIEFWDKNFMDVGSSLTEQLRKAINKCRVCIFLATKNSVESKWCLAELGAFWGAGTRVIVYLLDTNLGDNGIPLQFKEDLWTEDIDLVLRTIKSDIEASVNPNNKTYGIKILSPANDSYVKNPVQVRGTFEVRPPLQSVTVWECDPINRIYYPKKYVKFNHSDNLWFTSIHIGGIPNSERSIIVAALGDDGRVLFEYARKVADMVTALNDSRVKWPGMDFTTSDFVICDIVTVKSAID